MFGRNITETVGLVQQSASALYSGADVLTLTEEITEGRFKAGVLSGRYSYAQGKKWALAAEAATGEKFLMGDSEEHIIEAISSIVAADVLGSRKDKTRLPLCDHQGSGGKAPEAG